MNYSTAAIKPFTRKTLTLLLIFFLSLTGFQYQLQAQSFCSSPKDHGMGYSTSIYSVSLNEDGSHSIVLRIEHNGCPGPDCKALNHYSIEAIPGTYSDISYALIYGNVSYNGINYGPNLGGWDKDGFRIAGISGIGSGDAGIFTVTYTLTGGLQDQTMMAKAGGSSLEVTFTAQEFDDVLNCSIGGAYAMPEGGKVSDTLNKIGPELFSLANYIGVPVSDDIYQIIYDENNNLFYVLAEFTPASGQYAALLNILESNYGFRNTIPDADEIVITGEVPIMHLLSINELSSLLTARPVYPAGTNIGLLTTSQGDTSMLSHIARQIFTVSEPDGQRRQINGEGIKIGVLSNSFNTRTNPPNQANDDVLKFELPGKGIQSDGTVVPNPYNDTDIEVLKDFPLGEASDEGRAMMQIIHDIAPGADLVFRTGVLGSVDMAEGIHELDSVGCDVIVDDISYITQSFFEDDHLAQTVNDVVQNSGVSYFTSAGNFGDKSYSATFSPATTGLSGISGVPHVFGYNNGTEDILQLTNAEVSSDAGGPANFMIVLQWEDDDPTSTFYETKTDLDIYLTNEDGSGVIGFNRENYGEKAIEVLPFIAKESSLTNILVVKSSDNNVSVNFKYVVFKGQLEIQEYLNGNATIVGHANAAGAMTVGAIRYDKTPAYGGALEVMSYSSVGGLLVNGENRYKPDFTAPNGVNTTVDLGNGDWDHLTDPEADTDLFPNFFGTSAAAPHAAAVAALLMDGRYSYYDTSSSPFEIRSILSNTAVGSGNYDPAFGNGFIQADRALGNMANPSPIIHGISSITGGTPGIDTVSISLSASYLTEDTRIYFDGVELETNVDLLNESLQAEIYPFTELYPEINAYNPAMEGTNGKDGGMSEPVYFNQKPTIVGILGDTAKTYGESMPVVGLDYHVAYIDGSTSSLEDAGLTSSMIQRINEIEVLNNASALANAGTWPYYISVNEILNPYYNGPPPVAPGTEDSLLSNYNFYFDVGKLEISKLNMIISPNEKIITYGDDLNNFTYTFDYDSSNITQGPGGNNQIIQDSLQLAYQGDLIPEIVAVVDSGFYMADTSGGLVPNSYFMSEDAYNNAIATGKALALVNGKALALVNGQALALVNGQALALVNENELGQINGKALALVNAEALVNGQALALVNTEAQNNGQALALVNAQALALVNNPDPQWSDTAYMNGQALALVNTDALTNGKALALVNEEGLVNGQALALVNSTSFNQITNKEAVIILTVDDIITMNEAGSPDAVELISINTVSGIDATTNGVPHKIAAGAFIASNFNVEYALGDLYVDPAPVSFQFDELTAMYDGNPHAVSVTATYSGPVPGQEAFQVSYIDSLGNESFEAPVFAGDYTAKINIINSNYMIDPASPSSATLSISPAPVTFGFSGTDVIYDGTPQDIVVNPEYLSPAPAELTWDTYYFYDNSNQLEAPVNAGSYPVSLEITNPNYSLAPSGQSSSILNISPAPVSFEFADSLQTYTGNSLQLSSSVIYLTSTPETMTWDVFYFYNNEWNLSGPVEAGSYLAEAVVTDGNYTLANDGTDNAVLYIDPAPVSFDFQDTLKTYTGNPQGLTSVSVYLTPTPENMSFETSYFYNEQWNLDAPVESGIYPVHVTVTDANYVLGPGAQATSNLLIEPAGVDFSFSNTTQVYTGGPLNVSVQVSYLTSTPENITYDLYYYYEGQYNLDPPVQAGTYDVMVVITNINYQLIENGQDSTIFTIDPAPVSFVFSNTNPVYNGYAQSISANSMPEGVNFEILYFENGSYSTSAPVNAGAYNFEIQVIDNNYTAAPGNASSGVMNIIKADLSVEGDDQVINEGTAAPAFNFTYSGFVGNDDTLSVFGSGGPVYSIVESGTSNIYDPYSSGPGEYVIVFADISNYNILFNDPVNLFVNPDSPGTKAVVPSLDCVTDDGNGNFTAYFVYENKNNVPVYVLIGPDNIVSGGGNPDISQQPIKFEPGGGSWIAYFDGSQMTWSVSSQHHGHKTSQASNASSNSKNCNKSDEIADQGGEKEQASLAFPNPVSDKLYIDLDAGKNVRGIAVVNMFGKHEFVPCNFNSGHKLELDMSGLSAGVYMIKLQLEASVEVVRVIKQ